MENKYEKTDLLRGQAFMLKQQMQIMIAEVDEYWNELGLSDDCTRMKEKLEYAIGYVDELNNILEG